MQPFFKTTVKNYICSFLLAYILIKKTQRHDKFDAIKYCQLYKFLLLKKKLQEMVLKFRTKDGLLIYVSALLLREYLLVERNRPDPLYL